MKADLSCTGNTHPSPPVLWPTKAITEAISLIVPFWSSRMFRHTPRGMLEKSHIFGRLMNRKRAYPQWFNLLYPLNRSGNTSCQKTQ